MGSLDGKVALITGASSGIGEATAVALAGEGAAVALVARRGDRLAQLENRVESDGGRAISFEADVANHGQAEAAVAQTVGQLGGLDILINNAGVMLLGPVEGADIEDWQRMIDTNVLGVLYYTREVLPVMREAGAGHIVNVSSDAGRKTEAGSAVYNLTKWGVTGFSDALRQEVLESNIRVTCVEPGLVATELQSHNTNPIVVENFQKFRERVGTPLEAEDIADAIAYAVSLPDRVDINEILIRPTGQRR